MVFDYPFILNCKFRRNLANELQNHPKSYITLKMTMETTRGNMSIMQNFVLKLRPFKVNRLFSDNPCQKYWGHWGKLQKFVLMSAGDFIKSICWVIHPPPPNSMLDRRFPTKIDQHWVGGDGGNRPRNEILLNHWCVPMFLARIVVLKMEWLAITFSVYMSIGL